MTARCRELALEWRDLWLRIDGIEDSAAWAESRELRRLTEAATARVPARLAADRRLNERCAEEVYRVVQAQYSNAAEMEPPVG